MFYLRCPSCGYILANRQELYDKGLEEIESNPNNDEETKITLKEKLVQSLEFKKYCCNGRIIVTKNKTEIFN